MKDREAMIQRALDAKVKKMIVVGFNQKANRQALECAEEHDFMWATLGVHPCDVNELTKEELEWIREQVQAKPKVVAVGETGLDYHHMSFPKEEQAEAFRKQIRLSKELDVPCIVHSRDAAEDTLAILLERRSRKSDFSLLLLWFGLCQKVWETGFYTSFSGVVTYPQAKDIQEAAKHAPADLILVETDCPYLAPQIIRGKRK